MAISRSIQMSRGRNNKASAFALPTILISSIVMLMVLLVAVSSVTTTRTALNSQYYEQLSKAAGEAGVAYAEACLNANGGVPLWTDAAPLKPNTNCSGIDIVSCPTTSTNPLCSVTLNGNVRSSFSIGKPLVETPSVLVVGGGGGGGATASGGGAGGYVYSPTFDFGVGSYPVTVGAGGAGGVPAGPTSGSSGGDSTISTIVAKGGGGGVSHGGGNGLDGASGSGGAISTGTQYYGGRGIGSQGRNGGDGFIDSGWTGNNAGGGGAGGVGVSGGNSAGTGAGGAGLTNSITGTSTYYAGGGAGGEVNSTGVSNPTLGGLGGGGNANTDAAGSNATPNTGGGGGGGSYNGSYFAGGNGGSGVVIVSYPTGLLTATGGTITTSGGKTIHKFTSNGTFTVNTVTNSVKIIPNNGFVEVLRSSNKAVWRTYQQKTAPTSVVPDQCSGEAKSIYGWNNAVIQTAQTGDTISDPNALAISPGIGSVNPGPTYFRKDFSVTKAGTYNIEWLADDFGEMYIDGLFVQNATYPTVAKTSTTLSVGCHTTYIKLINRGILANPSTLKFSMKATGASIATVVSDSSWRVSAGSTVHYSSPNYYASPSWTTARDINAATAVNTNWNATSGDSTARFISSPNSYDGSGNYPSSQWTYFRDSRDIYVSASTQVRVSVVCDDNCFPFLDSSWVMSGAPYNNVYTTTVTLTPGVHKFALGLINGGGPAGFSFAAVRTSDNVALSVSDGNWQAASFWEPTVRDLYSYDNRFYPSPDETVCSCANINTVNLVPNPSAELNTTGWWANLATVSRVASGQVGSYKFSIARTSAGDAYGVLSLPDAPVPSQTYTLSLWAWADSSVSTSSQVFLQENGGLWRGVVSLGTLNLTTTKTRFSASGILPSNIYPALRVVISPTINNAENVHYDGLMLTKGGKLYGYADGNTSGWTWSGTADNSTSYGLAQ